MPDVIQLKNYKSKSIVSGGLKLICDGKFYTVDGEVRADIINARIGRSISVIDSEFIDWEEVKEALIKQEYPNIDDLTENDIERFNQIKSDLEKVAA